MNKDKVIGSVILVASIAVIAVYVWLTFFPPLPGADIFILKLTGSVAGVFGIIAWIGYTLATTTPKPIEEIEKELEAEKTGTEEASQQQA